MEQNFPDNTLYEMDNLMVRSLSLVILICALIGCGPPTAEIMNSWKKNHISDVIRSWGPPQQITTDGAGGRIYVWSQNVNIPLAKAKSKTKGTVTYSPFLDEYTIKSKTTYTKPVIIEGQKVRMFWVNKDGIVYHWQAKGFIVDEGTEAVIIIGVAIGAILVYIKYQQDQKRAKQWEKWLND